MSGSNLPPNAPTVNSIGIKSSAYVHIGWGRIEPPGTWAFNTVSIYPRSTMQPTWHLMSVHNHVISNLHVNNYVKCYDANSIAMSIASLNILIFTQTHIYLIIKKTFAYKQTVLIQIHVLSVLLCWHTLLKHVHCNRNRNSKSLLI